MTTATSAAPSFHGYLFQIERAFFHLAETQEKCSVFLETEDDVVVNLNSGKNLHQIFEQDKLSTTSKNPFSNSNENLWKSLNIWIDLITNKNLKIEESQFFLCTNKKITNKKSFVQKINSATSQTDCNIIYEELFAKCEKEIATKKPKKNKLYTPFTKMQKAIAIQFISKIKLIDFHQYNTNSDLKERIRNILQIPKGLAIEPIYSDLIGWITTKIIDSWKAKLPAEIKSEDFYTKYASVISKYENLPFIEMSKELITPSRRKPYLKQTFVLQLEKILLGEDEKIESIDDFILESVQRTKFAKQGFLTSRDWDEFDESLEQKWKDVFRKTNRLGDFNSEEDKGYEIFTECMSYRGILAGIQTLKKFTTSGTFHRLANKSKLGWHPKWNK